MAGSLVLVDSETASSSSGISLTGMTSTYDVYMVTASNVVVADDDTYIHGRFTESGTPNTTSNYDSAYKNLIDTTANSASGYQNRSNFYLVNNFIGNTAGEQFNMIAYIFNSQDSGEYTYITQEVSSAGYTYSLWGNQGGGVMTVTSTVDGLQLYPSGGTIASGDFKLYGLRK
jgi:hypothetical protein